MLRLVLACLTIAFLTGCRKQAEPVKIVVDYQSPVDYDITLAGNFGEPRPWHFHGGLDIKTGNVEGKQVFSIADGYVSRLTVNKFGFGNALYVNHPDGYTSVYCHLQRFADCYEQTLQRTGLHDTIDVRFAKSRFPVRAGDQIAVSGNTGHSTGPHLHLEIHHTETWALRDPMEFLGSLIADTVAPQAHSLMAIPQQNEGVFNGGFAKQTFGIEQQEPKPQHVEMVMHQEFTAWGRVGFALWADDYAQGVYNHYGIRHMTLSVDGHEVFSADVDSIPVSCQPEVNQWGDFDHWRHHHTWYMKMFREPGMRLPILHTSLDRGIIDFNEERPYHLNVVLRDYQNNRSTYSFVVRGQRDGRVRKSRSSMLLDDNMLWRKCLWPLHSWPVNQY